MITINQSFEDAEFERLKRVKDILNLPWHDLLLKVFDDEYERLKVSLSLESSKDMAINIDSHTEDNLKKEK